MNTTTRCILALGTFFFGLSYWSFEPLDPDLGWHLLGGLYVLEIGDVPRTDFINLFRNDWHDYHWLAQIVFGAAYKIGGFHGLMLLNGCIIGMLATTLFFIASGAGASLGTSLLLWSYSFATCSTILSIRPQVLSLLGLALAVLTALKLRPAQALLPLCALSILISNVHVYWIFVPIIWGMYVCLPRILGEKEQSVSLVWLGLLVLALTGLVSPYTFSQGQFQAAPLALILDYLDTPSILKSTISEFKSSLSAGWDAAGLVLVFVVLVSAHFRKLNSISRAREVSLAALGLVLACFQVKFLPLLGIFALPLLTQVVTLPSWLIQFRVAVGIAICSGIGAIYCYPPSPYSEANLRAMYPIDACEFVVRHGGSRVLTSFEHGGWCKFAANRVDRGNSLRVTADGRTQQLPSVYFEELFRLFKILPGWNGTLARWSPDFAVLSKESALAQVLGFAKDSWVIAHEDESFVVFKKI